MRVLGGRDEVKMAGLHQAWARGGSRLRPDRCRQAWAPTLSGGAENPYDAMILDVMLPDLDGFEVSRRLRDGGQWRLS